MLAEQLSAVREAGWRFLDVSDALRGLRDPRRLPPASALVTFDDGYRSLLQRGLAVLRELQCPGVVFVPTAHVGGVNAFDEGIAEPLEPLCTWDELRELEAKGISVQSHGFRHLHLSSVGPDLIQAEMELSKREVEDRLQKTVEVFAFPYGDGGRDPSAATRVLRRCGYRAACLYGGGPVELPAVDPYRLSRLSLGFGSDLVAELSESVA
jgi:peptidoglycan/xylan/chitin deacetylase (PgdA/CDA1 family)